MANVKSTWQGFVAVVIVTAVMLTPVTMAFAQNSGVRQQGAGKYAQLTAIWWQWIIEQPATGNPIFDTTGSDAAKGQPLTDVNVFLLAGSFGGPVTRTFTVPANTALFFPLLNNLGYAPEPACRPKIDQNQVPQLRMLGAQLIDGMSELHVVLDGVSLIGSVIRVKSPVFHVTSPDVDSILGPGTYTAVSDGYWLFLPALASGTHTLKFGGTSGDFTVNITDIINVP
ncbi:MAG: hypothetical protein OEW32_07685 [Nitrospira sp.]|nr:hypothetical protein [Nitrospira sp.]